MGLNVASALRLRCNLVVALAITSLAVPLVTWQLSSPKRSAHMFHKQDPYRGENPSAESRTGVTLRNPFFGECTGSFAFNTSDDSPQADVILTEATLDTRKISLQEFKLNRPFVRFFRRISVHFSIAENIRPVSPPQSFNQTNGPEPSNPRERSSAQIHPRLNETGVADGSALLVELDYMILLRCAKPFKVKRKMCAWSGVISVWAPDDVKTEQQFEADFAAMVARNDLLALHIVLEQATPASHRSSSLPAAVRPKLSLQCIDGLALHRDIPWLRDPPQGLCENSPDSLMLVGSPISQGKRNNAGAAEAANFAYRALQGVMEFHTVAISVVVSHTIEEIQSRCFYLSPPYRTRCAGRLHANNARQMANFKTAMDAELAALALPPEEQRRIVLSSFCRLGADHAHAERGHPCSALRADGQVVWGSIVHSQLGAYHRWAAALDLDEFFGGHPREAPHSFKRRIVSTPFFESAAALQDGYPALKFNWMYTVLPSKAYMRNISEAVGSGLPARLSITATDGSSVIGVPIEKFIMKNGKSAVRCTRALGSHVHTAIVPSAGDNLHSGERARAAGSAGGVYVWHVRMKDKYGERVQCAIDVGERHDGAVGGDTTAREMKIGKRRGG